MRFLAIVVLSAALLPAQSLDMSTLTLFNQPKDVWPTYNGDYSGRRYSALDQISAANIDQL
jgi:alcohol dehydrogenase (cytochrome c)